jgi:predicted ATPase/class 3 adenylate cyclase
MHRVVPELIVENFRAGHRSGEFEAVGMFLDLSGFSTMTDTLMQHGQHGAEVLAGLMHRVFDPLVESIFHYGGKIVGFAGDGIMALYPVDVDAKLTALRALTSAYVIHKQFEENPTRQTVYGEFSIYAKIGLGSGRVSWGILCSPNCEQATYYFRGTVVDEAAHAEHHARPGDIVLTKSIYELLQDKIETRPLASHQSFTDFLVDRPDPEPVVLPLVDLDIARRFMPEDVIAHDVRGEFRQVVNLFMRFPDLSASQLDDMMLKVFELRNKYGGLLSRMDFGDKGCNMLILWGAPVAYGNDIGRALNFLLDLKSAIDFPVTAGVTYYISHAGYLGSSMYEDYTCYGWGVNLASRFMMSAPVGEIWVDDRIARRVSNWFEIEFLNSQSFKGFAAEQKVHVLHRHKPTAEPTYQGELVGREQEFAELAHFLEPLWENNFAGLLLVSGDAGIGKGRLVHELRSAKQFEGRTVLWAVCQADQIQRHSFNPLRSWLLRYFGISASLSIEERRQSFDRKLDELLNVTADAELARELDRTRSILGALLDISWPDSLYEQLDPEGRYNNTFLALIALLKAESLRRPVIVFIEDLQFVDRDTKDLLARLKRAILAGTAPFPIAMIITSRRQGASLEKGLIDARLTLQGLSRDALEHLIEILLGGPAGPDLVSLVTERSEGNPYFAEQMIRYLQEESLIESGKLGWTLTKTLDDHFLPGDVRAVLVARLDQLVRGVRESVQTASVLGRQFEIPLLRHMLRDDEGVSRHVEEAEKAAIWSPLDEVHYLFSHGLLRDAAYEMQMQARRKELHALAVDALEHLYRDVKNRYAELAHHAKYADLGSKAQKYYLLAGKAAADSYQNHQAVEYYKRALSFTPLNDLRTQFDILFERVELFNRIAHRTAQLKDLETLEILAEQLNDQQCFMKVDMLFAHYYIAVSDYPSVVRRSEHVMELRRLVEDPEAVLDTYRVWPLALLRQGKLDEAMEIAQQGRQLAQLYGEVLKEGYILNSMGLIAIEQKDPSIGQICFEQALGIAKEKKDPRLESIILSNLGNLAGVIQQDYVSAREYYERGYVLIHERGERSSACGVLGNLGWVSGRMADFSTARSYLERSLALSKEIGNPYLETNALINLSAVAGAMADSQAALLYAKEALELSRKASDRSSEAWSLLYGGYAHLLLKDLQQAEESFRQSIAIRDELGQPSLKTEPAAGLIETLLLRESNVPAVIETERILTFLENGGTLEGTEEPLRVYYACYLALEKTKDPRARRLLESAVRLLEAQVSKLRDEGSRQQFVENVSWRAALRQAWRVQSA